MIWFSNNVQKTSVFEPSFSEPEIFCIQLTGAKKTETADFCPVN